MCSRRCEKAARKAAKTLANLPRTTKFETIEVVDDDSEEKEVGGVVDIHFGERYVSPITIYIYIICPGSSSHWSEYQGSIGSFSHYTGLNQTPATTSAGFDP